MIPQEMTSHDSARAQSSLPLRVTKRSLADHLGDPFADRPTGDRQTEQRRSRVLARTFHSSFDGL